MRSLMRNKKGVSETVGVVLMLGMAIALFSGVYLVSLNVIPFNPKDPSVRISGELVLDTDTNNIYLYLQHNGGDSLSFGTTKIFLSNYKTGDTIKNITIAGGHITTATNNEDDVWNIGEVLRYPNSLVSFGFDGIEEVKMIIIDEESNSIIAQDVFQVVT